MVQPPAPRGRSSLGVLGLLHWGCVRLGAVGAFTILLAGCSGNGTQQDTATGGQATGSSVSPSVSGSTGQGGVDAAGEWDPRSWKPTERIERVAMSEAEREEFWKGNVARRAQDLGVGVPQVERVAWMGSRQEAAEAVTSCLRESGFPGARLDVDGATVLDNLPESQVPAFDLALLVCDARYPIDPEISQDWSRAQVGLVYDYWDGYFIPCMAAHGYPVDTSEQPSRESFVSEFHSGARAWWAADRYDSLPEEDRATLVGECPPYPPDSVLYGQ